MKVLYWLMGIVGFMDWWSTVRQLYCNLEENAWARWSWCTFGMYGLLIYKALCIALFILILVNIRKIMPRLKWITVVFAIIMIVVTLLIALTNLAWISYDWMSWIPVL
jgi:hypothetical protein